MITYKKEYEQLVSPLFILGSAKQHKELQLKEKRIDENSLTEPIYMVKKGKASQEFVSDNTKEDEVRKGNVRIRSLEIWNPLPATSK